MPHFIFTQYRLILGTHLHLWRGDGGEVYSVRKDLTGLANAAFIAW